MTTKNITIVGLDTCSYTKSLIDALAGGTPKHLNFTYIECGSKFQRKCGGNGQSCESDHDCNGFYTNAPRVDL